jgi:hypothetical protein
MKHGVLLVGLLLLAGCDVSINTNAPATNTSAVVLSQPGSAQQQKQIADTANEFLLLLDAGRADMTWTSAGSVLKAATTEPNWVKGISGLRMGLGDCSSVINTRWRSPNNCRMRRLVITPPSRPNQPLQT